MNKKQFIITSSSYDAIILNNTEEQRVGTQSATSTFIRQLFIIDSDCEVIYVDENGGSYTRDAKAGDIVIQFYPNKDIKASDTLVIVSGQTEWVEKLNNYIDYVQKRKDNRSEVCECDRED